MKKGDLVKVTSHKRYVVDESDINMTGEVGMFVRYYGKGFWETDEYCLIYFGNMGIKLVDKKMLEIINE